MTKLFTFFILTVALLVPGLARADHGITCDTVYKYEAPQDVEACQAAGHTGFGAAVCIRHEIDTCTTASGTKFIRTRHHKTSHCIEVSTPWDEVQTQCAGWLAED